ncbi:MAG: rhamnulokinase [Acidimicrobiales bacterium]
MVSVDLGANSGRVAVGNFDGSRLSVAEVNRFANVPVLAHDRLYWDALRLYDGILEGLGLASRAARQPVASVAVDAWGVDFAIVDKAGHLLGNPVHYRDRRTEQAFEDVRALVAPREIFQATGVQLLPINTLYQLWAMQQAGDPALEKGSSLLMMPDLFNYWLGGVAAQEWTEATTTQCYDIGAGKWAWGLLGRLGLPAWPFGEVVPSGTVLGPLRPQVAEAVGAGNALVIAVASHDTASAVAAVPFQEPGCFFVSSGTWSALGAQMPKPVVDDRSFAAKLTNEGGPGGTSLLMGNLTGLWLLQECQRKWYRSRGVSDLSQLLALAEAAPAMRSLVDPNAPEFMPPGDMPARIAAACRSTGQEVPESPGEVVRCILESLAFMYRQAVEVIAGVTGRWPPALHIVGGGSLNSLLCQWTADATGLPVWAGPSEASEVGNLLVQAMALGELATTDEARALVRSSFPPVLYEPGDREPWDDSYDRFRRLAELSGSAPAQR